MLAFKIDVSDIIEHPGAEKEFRGQIRFDPVGIGERQVEFPEPVTAAGVLRNVSHGILAQGDLKATVRLECSRCLEKYDQLINSSIEELFVGLPAGRGETEKEGFPIVANIIDLEPAIYQLIVTEIPFKPLCRSDCAGLCPVCGKNKNKYPHSCQEEAIDIRMSKLKDYFKR